MSIRTKIHLSIIGLVLVISGGTNYVLYRTARQALFDEVRQRLSSIAADASLHINPSIHESLRSRKDESTAGYLRIKEELIRLKDSNPSIRYVYTMRPSKDPNVWQFVVDAEQNPELLSHIGDEYDASELPALKEGLAGPSADRQVTEDKWGAWVSGYAPIKNGHGRAVGIVGVDMSADQLVKEMAHLRTMGIATMFAASLLAVIFGAFMSSALMSPLSRFLTSLDATAKGDLNALVDDRRRDEIGQVARTFNKMLASLRHKDRMLSEMNTDYLTGLNNHRYFQQRLHEEMISADVHSTELALLMLDLDRFKQINDSFGHVVGDELLRQLAKILTDNLDEKYVAARYGGEEFAIIMPDTDLQTAAQVAENLREAVAQHDFALAPGIHADGMELPTSWVTMSVSIGVAVYPTHSTEQDGLIMAADIALYQAKHLGRNRVCTYDASLGDGRSDPYQVYAFIQDPSKSAIEALAAAVDARDHYTRNHSEHVSHYALQIAEVLHLSPEEKELVQKASLLHDVGKIGVPDYVLNKPSTLTGDEMKFVRAHPSIGEAIVRDSHNLDAILPGILYHHERYDGSGYPEGLAGEEIPLLARIIAVADAFDALTTDRPYRRALPVEQAIEILRQCSGTQFDPAIVEAFIEQITFQRSQQKKAA